MQAAQSISGTGEPTWENTIMNVSSARKASCVLLFRNKKVHKKQGFTNMLFKELFIIQYPQEI